MRGMLRISYSKKCGEGVVVGAREETRARRCGNCNGTGHNTRTCQIVIETSEEDIYD